MVTSLMYSLLKRRLVSKSMEDIGIKTKYARTGRRMKLSRLKA